MATNSPCRYAAVCALPIAILVCSLAGTSPVHAQASDEPGIEEVIVVGSRRQANTAVSSPVPVDNLRGDLFRNIGTSDMDDVLRTLIAAYNVKRLPLDDESSLVRPATLRGLPPDSTLVLINGKRLHRSAVLAGAFGGAQGPDTSVIPPSSIDRVEVLRDGASAQYGSDAIAGVILSLSAFVLTTTLNPCRRARAVRAPRL
jgi:iron complex outermembrane receptor protein